MEGDGEGELNSRQKERRHIHCSSPGLGPQVRFGEIDEIVARPLNTAFTM